MAYPTIIPVRLFKQGEFAVINKKKYMLEHTCKNLAVDEDTFYCSKCQNETHGYMVDDFGCTVGFGTAVAKCPNCGARVLRLVE